MKSGALERLVGAPSAPGAAIPPCMPPCIICCIACIMAWPCSGMPCMPGIRSEGDVGAGACSAWAGGVPGWWVSCSAWARAAPGRPASRLTERTIAVRFMGFHPWHRRAGVTFADAGLRKFVWARSARCRRSRRSGRHAAIRRGGLRIPSGDRSHGSRCMTLNSSPFTDGPNVSGPTGTAAIRQV